MQKNYFLKEFILLTGVFLFERFYCKGSFNSCDNGMRIYEYRDDF